MRKAGIFKGLRELSLLPAPLTPCDQKMFLGWFAILWLISAKDTDDPDKGYSHPFYLSNFKIQHFKF